jgi:hypothetical protein
MGVEVSVEVGREDEIWVNVAVTVEGMLVEDTAATVVTVLEEEAAVKRLVRGVIGTPSVGVKLIGVAIAIRESEGSRAVVPKGLELGDKPWPSVCEVLVRLLVVEEALVEDDVVEATTAELADGVGSSVVA